MKVDVNAAVMDIAERAGADNAKKNRASQRLLMCAPRHFGVDYVINPWMENQIGCAEPMRAREQWENLRNCLAESVSLDFVAPVAGLPDMVFTANAGLVIDDKAVVTRFQAKERRPEEAFFKDWFERKGFSLAPWPGDVAFEGAGDALFDRSRNLIWCGHGWRSSDKAAALLEKVFERRVVGLRLVDPRFYHLDTCLCPLPDGWLLYYPEAFDERSRALIAALTPAEKRIAVSEEDAALFACNAVAVRRRIFMNGASAALRARLGAAGFLPIITPLSEFLKAGGAAKCLTLEVASDAA